MVTPLGCGVDVTWKKILEGKSGANKVTNFKVDDLACQIACQIPRDPSAEGAFNPFGSIQSQVRFAFVFVRAVALEAGSREDGTHVTVET